MKNILFISLDTVRADVAYSGKFPGINALREDGVTFLNAISSSPLTPISHATVLTGLQPYNHGIRHLFKEKLRPDAKTITQLLKEKGYATGAVVSCPGMNRWYDFCRGFDHYDDEIPLLPDGTDPLQTVDVKKRGTALKRAPLVIDRAWEWIEKQKTSDQPFFLFMHFFDAHWPYEAPEKFAGDNSYEQEVAYSDHYLNVFIDKLKQAGLWEDLTLVCFSDHGEDLEGLYPNDKAGEELGHPEELGHGCLLYDQTQKVVLIMKGQGIERKKTIEQQVRLVDVAPTVLELLGMKEAEGVLDGVSLLPTLNGDELHLPAYCETFYPEEQTQATGGKFADTNNKIALRINNKHKTIKHLGSDFVEVYDLEGDENELRNLFKAL